MSAYRLYLNPTASSMACSDWHDTGFCPSAPADMDPLVDHFLSIFKHAEIRDGNGMETKTDVLMQILQR
jgi:hypothetical protein